MSTLAIIEKTARTVVNTADCAIGRDAARLVLDGLEGFRDDYEEHILHHRCLAGLQLPVPCVALCPAGVDVPGYMALVGEGRCADAVRLIRKDNPFPVSCAYICEHPCEARCRRNMIDNAINIRGLKRFAVDNAGDVPQPACAPSTGKKVAVIGGGPSGLSCAYYLALMGHKVTVYEERSKLGGMLRYGIPNYRFPRHLLDAEIESILSLGIEAHTGITVGVDIWVQELQKEYDCLYIAIGAHQDKKVGIPGEDSRNVMSAVEMLRSIGDDVMPDFTGKRVVVIGGGNVAMDVTRSSIRLGAEKVTCVYRRRVEDMTALPDEVTGAMAEGAEIAALMAPVRIEADEDGSATALWVQPQIIGEADKSGRPRPSKADLPEVRIPADIIVVAIGQGIEIQGFEQAGVPIKRGTFVAGLSGQVGDMDNLFAGGDCVTGPATAIRAIAAGKVAAANIDEHLGFHHEIKVDVDIPGPRLNNRAPHGRINTTEREACQRRCDFEDIECGLTEEGARTEASRCLRCDHYATAYSGDGGTKNGNTDHRRPHGDGAGGHHHSGGGADPAHHHPHPVLSEGHQRDRRLPHLHGGGGGLRPAGALLRQRRGRGHGGLHQLAPRAGGAPREPAPAAEPARDKVYQVHPQRQLQAPAADQRL